jgi:hypothetical protein
LAVHEEQHSLGDPGLHQPVDLVDQGEGLAAARRHRQEQVPLPFRDGLIDSGVGFLLIGPEFVVIVG